MRETTINYVRGEDLIYYFSSDIKEINYIRKLVAENDSVNIIFDETDKEEGGIEVSLPKEFFRRPKPQRKVSEETRQKASERFKKMWADKKGDNND